MKISNFKFQIYESKRDAGLASANIKSLKGFTLVELLIVVTIIGILASFLTANFITFRQRARDGLRKADLRSIQSALEIYRADQGSYLPSNSNNRMSANSCTINTPQIFTPLAVGTSTYMSKIPCEQSLGYNDGNYFYYSNGQTYTLAACLENSGDSQGTVPPDPDNTTYSAFAITSTCSSNRYYVVNNP